MTDRQTLTKTDLKDEDIEFILANTDLNREQIVQWYNDFKKNCPDSKLNRTQFTKFYKNFIPGDSTDEDRFCEYVFQAFDADNSGFIDFGEFLVSFWVRAKAPLKDKLAWLFDVYDNDRSGYISSWEVSRMLRLVFSMKNIKDDPYDKARKIFDQLDRSHDGRVTKLEFIAGCTKDETLRALLAPH